MSPEQLDGDTLDCRADIYSLAAVLYHLIAGRPPFDATSRPLMHQIYHAEPPPLRPARRRAAERLDALIQRAGQGPRRPPGRLGRVRAGAVGADHRPRGAARARCRACSTPSASTCCAAGLLQGLRRRRAVGGGAPRALAAPPFGHALYRKGEEGALPHHRQGQVEVFRDGQRVAQLGAGTSVGEMAYLAPSPDLRRTAPT
jgi:hypothetical protein